VAVGFFPLDDELALLPGQLTPRLQEQLVRLGAWMPFAKAAVMLGDFTRVEVNEDYARRHTEAAGAAYVAVQTAEVERLERDTPSPPPGPERLCLSADGAQVPLVGGDWAEVKTLAVGEVAAPLWEKGELVVRTQAVTYFSRLTDNHTFERLALVETQRRGVETAQQVGAVLDGAEWLQGFVDFHRRDALRILDFPHGAGYVGKIGQVVYGEGTPEQHSWLNTQLHRLKHDGPRDVLDDLRAVHLAHSDCTEVSEALAYLEKREAQLHYPTFRAAGWPIGSGMVESGNKLVVEARLKGSGMHWARCYVDPMLALRNIVCNDRWNEAWPQIETYQRQHTAAARTARRQKRHALRQTPPRALEPGSVAPSEIAPIREIPSTSVPVVPPPKVAGPHRPAPNHPWRRSPIGRAQYQPAKPREAAKL
jgi:hypothetical protein